MSGYRPPKQLESAVASNKGVSKSGLSAPTTEEVVAVSVAADIATAVNLPVARNVSNMAATLAAQNALARSDNNVVAKPMIVDADASKDRTVTSYKTRAGDTVNDVAKEHGISAQTLRWANDLSASDALDEGTRLKIPPVNGVIYKVQSGDTVASIAKKYQASADRIKLFNDLDLNKSLKAGKTIVIPDGILPDIERPGYVAPTTEYDYHNWQGGESYGTGYSTGNIYSETYGNKYYSGQCTWYAYERRVRLGMPLPAASNWGDATSWDSYARQSGYTVDYNPGVGSIMQNYGGAGHVAIVESVDRGVSVTISEMNYYAFGGGWNRIDHRSISWSDAVSGYYRYIH